ncbi:hypothetical protein Tco_1345992 [Tanacetum coccineum]
MSTSTHPIIVLSDFDVEDVFSFTNAPDYTLASLDYFPALPGNTFSDSSADLSKYLLASLAILPFHDDLYMKIMQAYNATNNELPIPSPEAPIAPPTVLPPSLVLPLSPLFDSCDFFLPEEILPPQKQARFLSSSSIDKPPRERIEQMEDKIEGLGNGRIIIQRDFNSLETELQKARTQITRLQREQMGHNDEIVLARVRISTLEMIIKDIHVRHRADMKSLLDKIHELKNHKGGPPDY